MKLTPRKMSLFAAGFAAALWIAAPATAAEVDPSGKPVAGVANVKTAAAPSAKRYHIWPRYRVASWYTSRLRYADATPVSYRSGYWHSRPPVLLIVGIYY